MNERGQTTAEYVAVAAIAVAITMGVVWLTMWNSINAALETIDSRITDYIVTLFS
jgi:hypothetical protein